MGKSLMGTDADRKGKRSQRRGASWGQRRRRQADSTACLHADGMSRHDGKWPMQEENCERGDEKEPHTQIMTTGVRSPNTGL